MKFKKKFKDITIIDCALIQEIDEIRDRRAGIRFMLDMLSKISGEIEANRTKWWNRVKKIYKINTGESLTYDHPTHTISLTKKDEEV